MKDELNESVYEGAGRTLVRGWRAAGQGTRARTIPVRRGERDERRPRGDAPAVALDLWDVYDALRRWPACARGPSERYAFDLALNRILTRIAKDGAAVVKFESKVAAQAYAKRVRETARIDAFRHMEVERHFREEAAPGDRANDQRGYRVIDRATVDHTEHWGQERRVNGEWMSARVGVESAQLLGRVHFDGCTVAELARESEVAESTVRSRLLRAEAELRACLEAEVGLRARPSAN